MRSDDEVVDFFNRHAPDVVVAAFDAPLVVCNPNGRRDCEAQVQRAYGRYGAGPYPSNLGMAAFASGTRAARLCARLQLDISVRSTADRRAVEVYPHPAMVVLFDLARVIPYKAKPGRTLESLSTAYAVLMDAMQQRLPDLRLASSPRWAEMREIAAHATRKADLGHIEDEIDAIFCAQLAHRWHVQGTRGNDVFGDDAGGAIVIPRPGAPDAAGHEAAAT